MTTVANPPTPALIPPPRELPGSDADLVYSLRVIETPAAIPPREWSSERDHLLHGLFDDYAERYANFRDRDHCDFSRAFGVIGPYVLVYATHGELPAPELAVLICITDGTTDREEFVGYADSMPWLSGKLRRMPNHHMNPDRFTYRCRHAYRDNWYYGTLPKRCVVSDSGEHWIANCPGTAERQARVAVTSRRDRAVENLLDNGRI
jgi:hypothetical protein